MSDDDELLGELREMAATVDPPPPRAIRRARKLAPVPQGPPPPMSTSALLLVVRRALYEVGLALADADGNAELAPYNLPVPRTRRRPDRTEPGLRPPGAGRPRAQPAFMSWLDWKPAGPPFFDEDGLFLSPVHAATHAVLVQGGVTDPQREAYRMIRDGGVMRERAEAWLVAEGHPLNPPPQYRS